FEPGPMFLIALKFAPVPAFSPEPKLVLGRSSKIMKSLLRARATNRGRPGENVGLQRVDCNRIAEVESCGGSGKKQSARQSWDDSARAGSLLPRRRGLWRWPGFVLWYQGRKPAPVRLRSQESLHWPRNH